MAIAVVGPVACPSAPVSPGSDAGVTLGGSPVWLRSSEEWLLEAVSRLCNGGFCAGALPDPAGNKTAPKVPIDAGQVSWLVAGPRRACAGWVRTRCRLLTGHGWGPGPVRRLLQSSVLLLLSCLWLLPGSGFEHEDVHSLRMGQSSSQASAVLPAWRHILKSFPKICCFPIFPYPAISLPSFFPSSFLWIHLGEFPAIILMFFRN